MKMKSVFSALFIPFGTCVKYSFWRRITATLSVSFSLGLIQTILVCFYLIQVDVDGNKEFSLNDLWILVYKLVLRGSFATAFELLSAKYCTQNSFEIESILHLLECVPVRNSCRSVAEYSFSWNFWRQKVENFEISLESAEFQNSNYFISLLSILLGDEEALEKFCDSWPERIAATVLFVDPLISSRSFVDWANKFRSSESNILDDVMVAIMSFDAAETLSICDRIDPWISCHLADIFGSANVISDASNELRDKYMLNYSKVLLDHHSLFSLGFEYCSLCGESGRSLASEYLSSISLDSEMKIDKLVHIAKRFNFEVKLFERIACTKSESGNLFDALLFYHKAKNEVKMKDICRQILVLYKEKGDFSLLRKASKITLEDCSYLDFMKKYSEFYDLYSAGAYEEAGKVLIFLLTCEDVTEFSTPLIIDSIPLLQSGSFSSDEILEIMRCLESVKTDKLLANNLINLRKLLAQELANSYLQESSK